MRVYIETYGCSMNFADSKLMEKILEENGYIIVNNIEEADIVIVNTCGVKLPTEEKIISRLKKIYSRFKNRLIIAGCLTLISKDRLIKMFPEASMISPRSIYRIVDVVKEIQENKVVRILDMENFDKASILFNPKDSVIGIVPISEGCLGNCYFCATKFARGRLFSFNPRYILELIKYHLSKGVKEIWLTSQDTGVYGLDKGSNIVELLKYILENLPKNKKVRIRIGMMNPLHAKIFIDEILDIMEKDERLFRFIHVPVQSGSNKVLKDMNRNHGVKEYIYVYKKFRERFPDGSFATDIIVGYPTETEEDFKKTIELIEKYPPDFLNLSKFWMRPNIEAIKFKELSSKIKKKRAKILREIWKVKKLEIWYKYLDSVIKEVLIDEKSKNAFVGRDINYRPIIVSEKVKLGDILDIKVKCISPLYLYGKILEI